MLFPMLTQMALFVEREKEAVPESIKLGLDELP